MQTVIKLKILKSEVGIPSLAFVQTFVRRAKIRESLLRIPANPLFYCRKNKVPNPDGERVGYWGGGGGGRGIPFFDQIEYIPAP